MAHPEGWDSIAELCGWNLASILSLEGNRQYEMMSLSEIAIERGSNPYDAFFDLIQGEKGTALMTDSTQSEDSLIRDPTRVPFTCLTGMANKSKCFPSIP
ncbi:hypothetical protein [Sphaerochaeta halotolerans]|jgi:N-acyl-D-aspartate/D-glutamate deacylase|uniref:Uncharacterized protein n=1 Tax=Sphaerochaeta halotolerans TaxID=2293840 RepID=A0A372MHN8_9SPIR|nr:hypothetical protein [Sphaerochaeta halotolerans]MXI86347.1 hypothetical protein [Sphaerochaeta halotolerans]RFU94700.1 hypothetical protein DYP60_07525 [Sphaerochaeta halotolerans]